ncbi:MAG: response regulator [Alphaproteobacteria bacterium]|nr:response regulator [Alphaproteobacteria bacterium]
MEQKTILVVEDNDFVRMQICRFLDDEGFETLESIDGQKALEVISNENVDMIVVDVRMEPINGFDFVRIIRGHGDKTPVLVVTGDENADILSEASKLGIMAVLKKPVQKDRLIKSVLRILHVGK